MVSDRLTVRLLLPALFLAFAVTAGAQTGAAAADTTVAASDFVAGLADKTVTAMTEPGIDKDERRRRFRGLMLDNFAFSGIAKWVLGRYWNRASESERTEYLKLFEDLMVVIYADRFAKYSGEKLEVGKAELRGENDILVHSQLTRPAGLEPVDVIWRIRKLDGQFKIVDLMVEGLSMGLTQQKEFASVIRQNGGQVQSLLDELKKRIAANS
ncbi:MAG: ABC transporter substrate-binding protein [Rhodospirillaceae bacterium]